jgi:HEAT repeat protein
MRKQSYIALIMVVVAILGGLVLFCLGSHAPDPIYHGKALSSWLECYHPFEPSSNRGSPEWKNADEAVRHAGINAVPMLLRMFQSGDPHRSAQAVEAFRNLDPAAQAVAMPGLIEVYERSICGTSHSYEFVIEVWAFSMGPMAKQAIPSLLRGVTNVNSSVRSQSIMALGRVHAEPKLVVPLLVKCLSDRDSTVRWIAAACLGDFAANSKPAVPALLQLLADTNSLVLGAVTNSLKNIDPEAAAKAGVK